MTTVTETTIYVQSYIILHNLNTVQVQGLLQSSMYLTESLRLLLITSYLSHAMVGSGIPVAKQENSALPPSSTVWSSGAEVITGGTVVTV